MLNGSCAGEAHLRDQAVLEGGPLHSTLGLRCMGQDEPNAQFFQRPGELRGVTPSPELQTLRSLVEFWNMLCRSLYRAIGIPWRSMISLSISM